MLGLRHSDTAGEEFCSGGLHHCYAMIEENLYRLVDTIPDTISADITMDDFVKANINTADSSLPLNFDFIEETGWTEKSVEAEMKRISNAKKMK